MYRTISCWMGGKKQFRVFNGLIFGGRFRTKKIANNSMVAVGEFCLDFLNQSIVHFIRADNSVTVFIQLLDHVGEVSGVFRYIHGIQMDPEMN